MFVAILLLFHCITYHCHIISIFLLFLRAYLYIYYYQVIMLNLYMYFLNNSTYYYSELTIIHSSYLIIINVFSSHNGILILLRIYVLPVQKQSLNLESTNSAICVLCMILQTKLSYLSPLFVIKPMSII